MSERTCDKPTDKGFANARFEVEFSKVPAVSYFSQKAYDYYEPPSIPPEDFEPTASPFELDLQASFYDGQQGALEFLLVRSAQSTDKALMRIYGPERGFKLFDGRIYFFRHVKNFEPPFPKERVDRIAILGITRQFKFGFFRQLDSLGAGYPHLDDGPALDFQMFSSPFVCLREDRPEPKRYDFCDTDLDEESLRGSMFYKELLIEAGSPSALATSSSAGAAGVSKQILL